ncbi:MAG: hypothetical protein Q9227_003464 [Pyrenula ochraceoflavens]
MSIESWVRHFANPRSLRRDRHKPKQSTLFLSFREREEKDVNGQGLDKIQLSRIAASAEFEASSDRETDLLPARDTKLKLIAHSLSTTSNSGTLLSKKRLCHLLFEALAITPFEQENGSSAIPSHAQEEEQDLWWIIVARATVQSYGLVVSTLLQQTLPIGEEIWYWDDILGSNAAMGIYTIQTFPARLWDFSKGTFAEARERYNSAINTHAEFERTNQSMTERWRRFYNLVQDSVQQRSSQLASFKILSPLAIHRTEAQRKQAGLRRLREMNSSAIGLLVEEGLSFGPLDSDATSARQPDSQSFEDWRSTVVKSISLVESVLRNVAAFETVTVFEDKVFNNVEDDPLVSNTSDGDASSIDPAALLNRVLQIINEYLPDQSSESAHLFANNARPSPLTRYWLPTLLGLLSSTTVLRILSARRAQLLTWIREFGSTCVDFWFNWVITPIKNLIGTIRHDSASEVAIMSRDSLRADRDSLERMVVDFVVDHPTNGVERVSPDIESVRAKVAEGDLTPVLKAYERDLRKPFIGTLRGDLVRALLIQIQKTKVDVEVAIGGIDSLLKSQELVFGFVGLTPGILISFAVFRWLSDVFGRRKGRAGQRRKGETIRILRNISRLLTNAHPTHQGTLTYADHGHLLLETHALRQRAAALVPGNAMRLFMEDLEDLEDVGGGVERQRSAVERVRWAYGKYLR